MALFGAVYHASTAAVADPTVSLSLRRRHIALFGIRHELKKGLDDCLPLFLACSVVAASEALLGDLASAIQHAQAACKLVRRYVSQHAQASKSESADSSLAAASQLTETVYILAVSMDMHSASYRLSHPPDLPAIYPALEGQAYSDNTTASELATLCLIHRCYHFTARAHHFKYDPAAASLQELLTEQSQHVAALRSRLQFLHTAELCDVQCSRLMLQAQCISTLIYVSAILNPFETFYDKHEQDFIELVRICDQLLARTPFPTTASRTRYQFDPGIFQPCYLTTMKCRNPAVRRRARSILTTLGREGPWNGPLLAAVASQAIELEEKFGHPVLEKNRIHGCTTFTTENGVAPCTQTFDSEFSLCRDLEGMLKSRDSGNPGWWIFIRNEVFLD